MRARPGHMYSSLEAAYDHFNAELFDGELPPCLITMQRQKGAYGYFSGSRFASHGNGAELTDEIALNPAHFASRKADEILSTLVHEMCHLWQHHFGKPSRNGYHNKEWVAKMHTVGLAPINVDDEKKETGQKVSHRVEPGGRFLAVCLAYVANNPTVLYCDRAGEGEASTRRQKAASKTKYTCPVCGLNAWAKPQTILLCGECEEELEAEEPEEPEED